MWGGADKGQRLHCVMNLPASAPEFMDAFKQVFDAAVWLPHQLPMVHLYAFHKSDDPEECKRHIMERAERAFGARIPGLRPRPASFLSATRQDGRQV